MSGKVFVFANQKGGVGKTTSVVNIGAYLAELGKKVILIDFDPQGNLTSSVSGDNQNSGIYEAITNRAGLDSVIQKTPVEGMSVIASNINLTGANIELVDVDNREFYLKQITDKLKDAYDYIFIDCPPSLGILTLNGLCAADAVVIPLQCEYFAMEGLSLLIKTIHMVQKGLNPNLYIGGIFFTMYDSRTRLAQDVVADVTAYFKTKVFKTIIPRNVRLSEAPSHGVPISKYDNNCLGAKSYLSLAQEVIKRG